MGGANIQIKVLLTLPPRAPSLIRHDVEVPPSAPAERAALRFAGLEAAQS